MSKKGEVKGFSIEGWFMQRESIDASSINTELSAIERGRRWNTSWRFIYWGITKASIKQDKRYASGKKLELESYRDYPDSVSNNAKKGIALNEKQGNKCATQVGKVRAQQLAQERATIVSHYKKDA